MRSQALTSRTAPGTATIWRLAAAVERRVARITYRRPRAKALQRDEFTGPWTAGLSRGLSLFVEGPGTAGRRERRP